jgi:hypothetical protein
MASHGQSEGGTSGASGPGGEGARWASDPWNPKGIRYWDGTQWTDKVDPTALPVDRSLSADTLVLMAGTAGIFGFLGSLVPLFGALLGAASPLGVWAGFRYLSMERLGGGRRTVSSRRWAILGIVFGVLGTILWLFWCALVAYELGNARDPFRGL